MGVDHGADIGTPAIGLQVQGRLGRGAQRALAVAGGVLGGLQLTLRSLQLRGELGHPAFGGLVGGGRESWRGGGSYRGNGRRWATALQGSK